jgi:hypothetical protein
MPLPTKAQILNYLNEDNAVKVEVGLVLTK